MKYSPSQIQSKGNKLKALLKECGHDVKDLNDVREALKIAKTHPGVHWIEPSGKVSDATAEQILQAYLALQ